MLYRSVYYYCCGSNTRSESIGYSRKNSELRRNSMRKTHNSQTHFVKRLLYEWRVTCLSRDHHTLTYYVYTEIEFNLFTLFSMRTNVLYIGINLYKHMINLSACTFVHELEMSSTKCYNVCKNCGWRSIHLYQCIFKGFTWLMHRLKILLLYLAIEVRSVKTGLNERF